MKTIQYFRDPETRLLISRVGSEVAVPVLNFEESLTQQHFKKQYPLEKHDVIAVSKWYRGLLPISNRKIRRLYTLEWINYHREFWGLKPLKRRANNHEMTSLWKGCIFRHGGHTFTVVKVQLYNANPDLYGVVLEDEQKRITEWNLGGLKVYLKANPDSVEHATMGLIREQCS